MSVVSLKVLLAKSTFCKLIFGFSRNELAQPAKTKNKIKSFRIPNKSHKLTFFSMNFSVLYQDQNFLAINKPAGFHVHRPEQNGDKVPRHKIILHQLRNQVGQKLYPVHRLDVATSGVLLFALSSSAASR